MKHTFAIDLTDLEMSMLKAAALKYESYIVLTNKKIKASEAEALLSAMDKLDEAMN